MEVDKRDDKSIDSATLELLVLSDSAISELLNLRRDSRISTPMKDQVDHLLLKLRFLNLYTQCLAKWNEAVQDIQLEGFLKMFKILDIKTTLGGEMKGLHSTGIKALETQDCQVWKILASELLEKVKLCKPKVYEDLDLLVRCLYLERPLRFKFSCFELQKFYGCILDSLNDLVRLKADTIPDINIEIQAMKERLQLLMQIYEFNQSMDSSNKDVEDLNLLIQTWICNAACLSLWYWTRIQGIREYEKKIILSTPRIIIMFLVTLKCLWSLSLNRLLMHEGVLKFADFYLEIMQLYPFKDDIEALHSGLIFLTTFLIDPPLTKNAESIFKEIEFLICSLGSNKLERSIAQKSNDRDKTLLEKMNGVMAEVRKFFVGIFQDLSSFNFPRTNLLGFLDSLLENLEGTSEHSTNREVVMVQNELQSLRPFLRTIMEFQKENLEIKDLWTRIVNVVYRAKIGIQLLLYVNSSFCHDVKCLSDITNEIKILKSEVNKIQDQVTFNIKVPAAEKYTSPAQANKIEINEEFVGFKDELETVIDQLIGGSSAFNIVSIFGMAGQGKTTLAKKIYHDPSVQKHFDKRAWCCVSQTYQSKMLFLDILSGIVPNGDFSSKAQEELEELLHQRLLGQRYLIVIDDIWDIKAWNALKCSFPDQKNGSRIIFTSRIEDVAIQAKHDCILHHLRQLSYHESLELLKKKLFGTKDLHPYLMDVAKWIATDCNGLPLAVVVIAGILSKKVDDLDWWNHVAQSIHSQASNGCMDLLELSYNHLPEFLKPCFLYFGAFPEDSVIRVRKLTQLWISEGFIRKSEVKNLEDVANEYLMDLVARSLVMVAQRSSTGRIKACRIHDLLHAFCLEKGGKENFLHVASRNFTEVFKNYRYRICFESEEDYFELRSGPCLHSLLFLATGYPGFHNGLFLCICNFKLLQVLDMEGIGFHGYFREEIALLVHLRYLAINNWDRSSLSIPPSIANLRNLETFRVSGRSRYMNGGIYLPIYFPNTIWTMKRLRHIDVGPFTAFVSVDCEPQESSALDNIQTFSALSLCYGEATEKLLRRIPNVRKLGCIFYYSCELCNKFPPSIYHGEVFRCQCGDSYKECNQSPVLEFLSQLESLNIRGQLSRSYALFSFPSTLKKLTLHFFRLSRSQISTIARLHKLEVLKLLSCHFDGTTWELQDDEFPKLKFLKLRDSNIAGWDIIGDYPFPCLEQLIVDGCEVLKIPYLFLELITTLKRIKVRAYSREVLSSARQLREDFEHIDFRIGRHLSID